MRVVVQRVKYAKCHIDGQTYSSIEHGFMCLVGLKEGDSLADVEKMADKVSKLRIFDDDHGKMNLDLKAVGGSVLSISQFTLYGDAKKGNRPSFITAMAPDQAVKLYDAFNEYLKSKGIETQSGIFGADMKIELVNDGPITILLDSES